MWQSSLAEAPVSPSGARGSLPLACSSSRASCWPLRATARTARGCRRRRPSARLCTTRRCRRRWRAGSPRVRTMPLDEQHRQGELLRRPAGGGGGGGRPGRPRAGRDRARWEGPRRQRRGSEPARAVRAGCAVPGRDAASSAPAPGKPRCCGARRDRGADRPAERALPGVERAGDGHPAGVSRVALPRRWRPAGPMQRTPGQMGDGGAAAASHGSGCGRRGAGPRPAVDPGRAGERRRVRIAGRCHDRARRIPPLREPAARRAGPRRHLSVARLSGICAGRAREPGARRLRRARGRALRCDRVRAARRAGAGAARRPPAGDRVPRLPAGDDRRLERLERCGRGGIRRGRARTGGARRRVRPRRSRSPGG